MQGSSDVLRKAKPPDKSSQKEKILFSKEQLDSIVAKLNCRVTNETAPELIQVREIQYPINLNPAQSSQLLTEVMEGESICCPASNPLGIEKACPDTESGMKMRQPASPSSIRKIKLDRPQSKDPFSFHKSLPLVIEDLLEKSSSLRKPVLSFNASEEAASKNLKVLKDNGWNLEKVLSLNSPFITNYGSEFKSVDDLHALLKFHPRWEGLKQKLISGCSYPLEDLEEPLRKLDIGESKRYGNHKSALKYERFLEKAMKKEIKKGWAIILPDESVDEIPDLVISPLGVADHLGIAENGEYCPMRDDECRCKIIVI